MRWQEGGSWSRPPGPPSEILQADSAGDTEGSKMTMMVANHNIHLVDEPCFANSAPLNGEFTVQLTLCGVVM